MSEKDIDLKTWFSQNGISIRYEWMSLQEYEINGYRQAYVTASVKASSFQNAREQAEEALEYIEFNIEGAYVGEQTPCVMWSQFMDDLERDYDIYGPEKPKKDD